MSNNNQVVKLDQKQDAMGELVKATEQLLSICGEANIPMVNSHAVRKMSRFLAAIDGARDAVSKAKEYL